LSVIDQATRKIFLAVNRTSLSWVSSNGKHANITATLLDVAQVCHNIQKLDLTSENGDADSEQLSNAVAQLARGSALEQLTLCLKIPQHVLALALQNCSYLTQLTITRSGSAPVILLPSEAAIPTLTDLYTNWLISDATLVAIGRRCSQLMSLKANNDPSVLVTVVGVAAVVQGCLLLRRTNLHTRWVSSDDLRVELNRRCPNFLLIMTEWQGMNDGLAQKVLMASPAVKEVSFVYCDWLTDATLAVCAEHCPLLEGIRLSDRAPRFTTAGVLQLIHLGTKLRRVDFGYCPQLGDEVVLAVAQCCPLLQDFKCPPHTSDAAFVLLAESCPELTTAGFARTDISDTALVAIATYCKKITTVYMWGCKKISVEGVRAVGLHCASLITLMLPSHLSALEVESLKAQFPEVWVA
jgi:hypothetical protein